jgi:cytochrome c553
MLSACLLLTSFFHLAFADHDEDHEKKESKFLAPVNNDTFKQKCGACHFAYQPGLLPSASWMQILANLDDHFGEAVELDDDSKKVISNYLKINSAENSSAKRAVKIMRSVGTQVPLRITDIRYIQKKHHEISSDVLKRKSIGSLSNCSACHTTADQGNYEDDFVKIPK